MPTYTDPDNRPWTCPSITLSEMLVLQQIWRRAVAESVGAPCRIHDLRHTHASWLIGASEHRKAIQTRLGHSSIHVTIDRFGHLTDALNHQLAFRLDAIAATARSHSVGREAPDISVTCSSL